MKACFLLLVSLVTCIGQDDSPFLSKGSSLLNGLISIWRLEETPAIPRLDSGPFGNNLSLSGTPSYSLTGQVGVCSSFASASSQYAWCSDNASLRVGAGQSIEIHAWIKPTTIPAWAGIVTKCDFSGVTNDYHLNFNNLTGKVHFNIVTTSNVYAAQWASVLSAGTAYYVVCYYDFSRNKVGIDVNNSGTPVETTTAGTILQTTQPLAIGGWYGGGGGFWNGLIDEVKIWKRILTPSERTKVYASAAGTTSPKFYDSYVKSGNLSTGAVSSIVISNGNYNAFPGLTQLTNGSLYCTFFCGSSHTDTNGTNFDCYSTDSGATWSTPAPIPGTTHLSGGDIVSLANGTLLAVWSDNAGSTNNYIWTGTQSGNTVTWTNNGFFPSPWNSLCITPSRPCQLSSGDIILAIQGQNSGASNRSCGVMKSSNNGLTWVSFVVAVPGTATDAYSEAQPVQLPSHRINMIVRRDAPSAAYVLVYSDDLGATWSSPVLITTATGSSAGLPGLYSMPSGAQFWFTRKGAGNESSYATSWNFGDAWTPFITYGTAGKLSVYQSAVVMSNGQLALVEAEDVSSLVTAQIRFQNFLDK